MIYRIEYLASVVDEDIPKLPKPAKQAAPEAWAEYEQLKAQNYVRINPKYV